MKPPRKSKQRKAEEIKTMRISQLVELRFIVLKPDNGIIEVINSADRGRVCSLKVSDFPSIEDAKIYAELLRLAPLLLLSHLNDTDHIEKALKNLELRLDKIFTKESASRENKKRKVKQHS